MEKLPKNWVNSKLNDLSTIQSGGTPSRGKNQYWNGDIPWVKISDIKNWFVDETVEFITEEGLNNSSTKVFPKGTILFTIFATIGKVGVLNIDATTNQAIAGITPVNNIEHKFLTYSLLELSESLQKIGKGVAQSNINLTILKDLNVPLPPLAEQQRIVAKLDDLFGHLEQVKTRLEKIPDLLKNFRQAILTQAVTGKLTEEWRVGKELDDIKDYITSLKTLKENKIEKRDNKTPVYESLEIYDIPKSWKWVRLWDISYLVTSGSRGWSSYYSDEGAYFVRSAEINNNKLRLEEAIKVNLPEKIEGKRSLIEKGNILTTVTGANVGKCAKIENNIPEAYVSQSVALIKLVNEELTDYVHISMLAPNAGGGMLKDMAYGLGRPVLSLPQIKSIMIPLASMEEQTEIVQRVESLFAKADAIEAKYNMLKAQIDNLPQAILAKAFKGELVEQLPADGNAADLLKEIQKLKAEAQPKGKKKKKKSIGIK